MKLGEHAKFAAHVVGRFDFAAERRTPKNHFSRANFEGVSEVRMTARILANDKRSCLIRETAAKERFKLREVELFSRSQGGRLILKASHVSLACSPLPISQKSRVVQVLKRVKCAQRETISGEQKFAVGAVARHPGHLQSLLRRKMQGALHGYGDGPAGSEDGEGFALACGGQKLRKTAIDAGRERLPEFEADDRQLLVEPHGYYPIDESFKKSPECGL